MTFLSLLAFRLGREPGPLAPLPTPMVPPPGTSQIYSSKIKFLNGLKLGNYFFNFFILFFDISRYLADKYFDIVWRYPPQNQGWQYGTVRSEFAYYVPRNLNRTVPQGRRQLREIGGAKLKSGGQS